MRHFSKSVESPIGFLPLSLDIKRERGLVSSSQSYNTEKYKQKNHYYVSLKEQNLTNLIL